MHTMHRVHDVCMPCIHTSGTSTLVIYVYVISIYYYVCIYARMHRTHCTWCTDTNRVLVRVVLILVVLRAYSYSISMHTTRT